MSNWFSAKAVIGSCAILLFAFLAVSVAGATNPIQNLLTQSNGAVPPSSQVGSSSLTTSLSIPVTISNMQGSSTGPNFQQMITLNPSPFSANEASDLGNIRFYQGSTELYSWCQSGCSSSSSSAVFWVLMPDGILANSQSVINMTFLGTGTEYDGVYAGEAPQLSGSYGQYDNGASIFSSYDNFAGPSINPQWVVNGANVIVNDGITVSLGNPKTVADWARQGLILNKNLYGTSYIIGAQVTSYHAPSAANLYLSTLDIPTAYTMPYSHVFENMIYQGYNGGSLMCLAFVFPTTGFVCYSTIPQTPFIAELARGSSGASASVNYQTPSQIWPYTNKTSEYPAFGVDDGFLGSHLSLQYFYIRAYPPNDVMPSASVEGQSSVPVATTSYYTTTVPQTITTSAFTTTIPQNSVSTWSISLSKGWNMIPTYGVTESSLLDCQPNAALLSNTTLVYVPSTGSYMSSYKATFQSGSYTDPNMNDFGGWFYSPTSCIIQYAPDSLIYESPPTTLSSGWNFFTVMPWMVGQTISSVFGSCNVEELARYNDGQWSVENANTFSGASSSLFYGGLVGESFVVKVSTACDLQGQPSISAPPQLPAST